MTKLQYIQERLGDADLRANLSKVVNDVDALIPQSEEEFYDIQKFGLYPAEECIPFITKQGTPFYQLDNMSLAPKGDEQNYRTCNNLQSTHDDTSCSVFKLRLRAQL
jgi:hypothetical protein